jgi:hypothetical protein
MTHHDLSAGSFVVVHNGRVTDDANYLLPAYYRWAKATPQSVVGAGHACSAAPNRTPIMTPINASYTSRCRGSSDLRSRLILRHGQPLFAAQSIEIGEAESTAAPTTVAAIRTNLRIFILPAEHGG